jgi:SAM-dependent methyltransferase
MLGNFGLLPQGVQRVTGLDLAGKRTVDLPRVCQRIQQQDIPVPANYAELLRYVAYDGSHFPFEDEAFDIVISWSAFEHITDVPQVLREIKRVCRRNGLVFIQVYPWYHCLQGSHLTDYISEPYFHLKRPSEWVWQKLTEYVDQHPEERDFVFENMWPEYQTLNRYSANRFYADVIAAGFTVRKAVTITLDRDLTEAPPDIPLADLVIHATKMLLLPNPSDGDGENRSKKTVELREIQELKTALRVRDMQIAELKESWSWKITAPVRSLGSLFMRGRK